MLRHLPDDDEDNPAVDEYNVLRQGNELGQGERNYILRCYCWSHHSRAVTFTQLNIQLIREL